MKISELRSKQEQLVADARAALAEINDDTPEARATELNEQHDRAMAEYDRIEARIGVHDFASAICKRIAG